jgi:23S rRNA pseudoU1915 N3-methylase RlmH
MKIMNVSFAIDVKKIEHVQALTEFMRVLGEHAVQAVEVEQAPEPKKTQAPKAKKAEAQDLKEEVQPEPVKAQEPESSIDVETLRAKVADLAKASVENRSAIKVKLTEYGAASVSTLETGYYEPFYDFLTQM